jgi:hypothetical protein
VARVAATGTHPKDRHQGLHLALGLLLFVLGLGLALTRMAPLLELGTLRLSAPWVMTDFRSVVYYPSRAFWDGLNPYDSSRYMDLYPVSAPVSPYAPALFLLFAPFGLLPLGISSAVYFILNIGLTVVVAWAALRLSGWRPTVSSILGFSGILLLSRPGHWNLLSGQVTSIMVLAVYGTLVVAYRRPRVSGFGVALALLKPSFGVPLAAALVARRAHRAVAWGVGIAAIVNLPILLILVRRQGGVPAFLSSLGESLRLYASRPENDPIQGVWRIDLAASITRFTGYSIETWAALLLTALIALPVFLLSRRTAESTDPTQKTLLSSIVCCGILLSMYHQAYDLLLLALPGAVLARALYQRSPPRRLHFAQAVPFIVISLNYFATLSVLTAAKLSPGWRLVVISANGLALIALYSLYLLENTQVGASQVTSRVYTKPPIDV